MRALAVYLIFIVAIAWGGEAAAQGCAMCKTAVGGPSDPLASGINTSILFMMSMPFVLVGVVGGWLVYMFRGSQPDTVEQPGAEPGLKLLSTEREGAR